MRYLLTLVLLPACVFAEPVYLENEGQKHAALLLHNRSQALMKQVVTCLKSMKDSSLSKDERFATCTCKNKDGHLALKNAYQAILNEYPSLSGKTFNVKDPANNRHVAIKMSNYPKRIERFACPAS